MCDWQQSEEQALQLLSRLALPQQAGQQPPRSSSGGAPLAAGGVRGAAGDGSNCLTVAMAAAAAAAQAAAAVAASAAVGRAAVDPVDANTPQAVRADVAAGIIREGATGSEVAAEAGAVDMPVAAQAPAASAPAPPAELQAEYERRVGAVRDLVQQLNEALKGLNDLQGQVGGGGGVP